MSQSVKLSDEILGSAREESKVFERSIAGQIEYWAQLGRAVEGLLNVRQIRALRAPGKLKPVTDCLDQVNTKNGKAKLQKHLASRSFPHYEADPEQEGVFLRTDAHGAQVRGRFVGRDFLPE